jgi:hypothetical protein
MLLLLLLFACAVKEMLLGSKINLLMLCVPLGIAAHLAQWGATAVFILVSSCCIRIYAVHCTDPFVNFLCPAALQLPANENILSLSSSW